MLSLEGQQLGNYDVIRRISKGGMGAVYEGRQRTAFGRQVAIKVILGDYATDRDMRRRFAREARTIARLHHPHILPLIEFGDEKGILYLVMPFIEGGTLTHYLRRSLPGLDEVSAIYQQLLDAVEYAHDSGLIHRDIKSSNVLLEERKSGHPYGYLADFGLVRSTRQPDNSQTGKPIPLDQVPGTPHYMAPEQTRGIVTQLTDIYALGVLLFQMLTGEFPYNDPDDVRVIEMHLQDPVPSPCERDASIPFELGEVVRKAMAKRPEDRYRNIAALREAFLAAVGSTTPADLADDDMEAEFADDDEDVLIEEVGDEETPPLKRLPTPLTLYEPTPPREEEPVALADEQVLPRPAAPRARTGQLPPVAVREVRDYYGKRPARPTRNLRESQRVTDSVRPRPRITEEPAERETARVPRSTRRRKRTGAWLWFTVLVPLLLLALLLLPRVLGFSLFPVGFPLLGASPVATVYITAQSKTLQDKYILTASPLVKKIDLVTHTIPDRLISNSASARSTVQTSGSQTAGGATAHGFVTLLNNGDNAVNVAAGSVFITQNGISFKVVQSVVVPAQQDGGRATAAMVAVQPGAAGNIPAHALDGPCCNGNVQVRNSQAFVGGSDPQTAHTVTQADIDSVRKSLVPRLEQQIAQQLTQSLQHDEVMVGTPTYAVNATASKPVGTQTDQVTVTVNVVGSATIYSKTLVTQTAVQLLKTSAIQTLDSNFQAQGDPTITSTPTAQSGKDGIAYISVAVKGVWVYVLSPQQLSQWRQSIKGATSAAALAYLNSQTGIATVQINLPFGTDHLPGSTNDINIITVNQ